MATNIDNLPQLAADPIICTNADWRDVLQFQYADGSLDSNGDSNAGQPIDLTGIAFEATLRGTISDQGTMLNMTTTNGLLVVDTSQGLLSFAVPFDGNRGFCTRYLQFPSGVMDLLAKADGKIINMFMVSGGANVTINGGITSDA